MWRSVVALAVAGALLPPRLRLDHLAPLLDGEGTGVAHIVLAHGGGGAALPGGRSRVVEKTHRLGLEHGGAAILGRAWAPTRWGRGRVVS